MTKLKLSSSKYTFFAVLEEALSPETCASFLTMLPLKEKVIHVRWSGEAFWIPYGDNHVHLPIENATSYPSKGEVLLYPGGISEMEIIFAYGSCMFSSRVGQLPGNHFMTITEGIDQLADFGKEILWKGAQELTIERC